MTTAYRDWQGRKVQVGDQTLEAVLAVLGGEPPLARTQPGTAAAPLAAPWHPADHPAAPSGPRSGWGFTVQLYSVRSHRSWGHGDLRDLADLATWSGRALGAAFVLINPLHAAEPVPPVSASPYLPMSRRFISPLYLRVEDIPEYALLPPAQRRRIDRPGRPVARRQHQPRPHRPRRGLGGQAGRPGDRPRVPAGAGAACRVPAVHRPCGPGTGGLGHLVRARGDPRARLAVLARGPAVAAVGGGRCGARAAARRGPVPRLAAVVRPGTAGRGPGGGAGGGHEHRRDRRPGGGRAPGRGRRLGVP